MRLLCGCAVPFSFFFGSYGSRDAAGLVPVPLGPSSFCIRTQRTAYCPRPHVRTYILGHVGPLGPSLDINGLLVPVYRVGPTLYWGHAPVTPLAQGPRTAMAFPA